MSEEDTTCPACGRDDFASIGAMRQHYAMSEDENHKGSISFETVECEECGTEFEGRKSINRKYCTGCDRKGVYVDDSVLAQWKCENGNPFKGKSHTDKTKKEISNSIEEWHEENDNPFKGESHTEESKRQMSESHDGKNISEDHKEALSQSLSGKDAPFFGITGEDHPSYDHNKTERWREAMANRSGENAAWYGVTGKDHPTWKGGSTDKYSTAFHQNRPKALERDDYECRVCGMSREDHREWCGKDLTAHHIIPRDDFIDEVGEKPPDEAGAMSNLFTVCKHCHRSVEYGLIEIPSNGNQMSAMDW